MEYIIYSPLDVLLPRKTKADKKYTLNINIYRNTHYQILNQAKNIYNRNLKKQIEVLPEFEYLSEVSYIIYKKSARDFDTPNIGSIISKFFMDALVIYHKIPDDNYRYTPRHIFDFGGVGSSDYCKIILKGKEKNMNLSLKLTQEDIINALKNTYGNNIPEECLNNLKFQVDSNNNVYAETEYSNFIPLTPANAPVKAQIIPKTVQSTHNIQMRRREKSLADEFVENICPSDRSSGEDGGGNNTEDSSERDNSVNTNDNEEVGVRVENPDNAEPEVEAPSMEEKTETVEEVKTNTFGTRNMRRRVL